MMTPTHDDVVAASRLIAPHVHRTPVFASATLDRELGAAVRFKCENLQRVGAFKARGAVHAVLRLDPAAAARGVTTHSSGNHAAALAYAAAIRGIPCVVVMPDDTPGIKVDAVRGYGASILFCPRPERERVAASVVRERGMTFIHPNTHPDVIAGQGTAALELFEECPDLDWVLAPVGGGGLLAGTALAARGAAPAVRVVGAEPDACDDARRSLESGVLQPAVPSPRTRADGLMTGLGAVNFEILRACGARVIGVDEKAILQACFFFAYRMKLVVEPSAATVLAALRRVTAEIHGLRIGAILSGGNTDLGWASD